MINVRKYDALVKVRSAKAASDKVSSTSPYGTSSDQSPEASVDTPTPATASGNKRGSMSLAKSQPNPPVASEGEPGPSNEFLMS